MTLPLQYWLALLGMPPHFLSAGMLSSPFFGIRLLQADGWLGCISLSYLVHNHGAFFGLVLDKLFYRV
ncbi:hypothetical protein DL96DRAFT_1600472, partial [Flagelloscypha sp. PMI_526]